MAFPEALPSPQTIGAILENPQGATVDHKKVLELIGSRILFLKTYTPEKVRILSSTILEAVFNISKLFPDCKLVMIGSTPNHLNEPWGNHDIDFQIVPCKSQSTLPTNMCDITTLYPESVFKNEPNQLPGTSFYTISEAEPISRSGVILRTRHSPGHPEEIKSLAIVIHPGFLIRPQLDSPILEIGFPTAGLPAPSIDATMRNIIIMNPQGSGLLVYLKSLLHEPPNWISEGSLLMGYMYLKSMTKGLSDLPQPPILNKFDLNTNPSDPYHYLAHIVPLVIEASKLKIFREKLVDPSFLKFLSGVIPAIIYFINQANFPSQGGKWLFFQEAMSINPYQINVLNAFTFLLERKLISDGCDTKQRKHLLVRASNNVFHTQRCHIEAFINPKDTVENVLGQDYPIYS